MSGRLVGSAGFGPHCEVCQAPQAGVNRTQIVGKFEIHQGNTAHTDLVVQITVAGVALLHTNSCCQPPEASCRRSVDSIMK